MTALEHSLGLEAHLEGGYYRQTYESGAVTDTAVGPRPYMNSIYYLLSAARPVGHLHRNRSAITHFHHLGGAAVYLLVAPDGTVTEVVLGPDLTAGEVPSFTAPGGWWKTSRIDPAAVSHCLISEAVAPGFHFDDHEMATREGFAAEHPHLVDRFAPFILGEPR